MHATLDDWMRHEAIPFAVDPPETLHAAVDSVVAALGDSVELLSFGEAFHSGEEILILRNRLFQRLVEAHGYSAIAIESSFPRGRLVNEYVAGRGPVSYEAVQDTGFGSGFGRLEANRELVEWMRRYNTDPAHSVPLRFYGFDMPTGTTPGNTSPRQVLEFVLDYLSSIAGPSASERRQHIESHLGQDSDWENPAAWASVGLSPAAKALRLETEDLVTELRTRGPDLIAQSDRDRYLEALHYAAMARQFLSYYAALAPTAEWMGSGGQKGAPPAGPLAVRDALMADNLAYLVARERGRGKVFAFAHNTHLQRGKAVWPGGGQKFTWWPAGAHLHETLGPRYAVIGSAVGVSESNGIGHPEAGSLEARLTALPGPARFIPTHQGQGLPAAEIAALPTRSGSTKNPTYAALAPHSLTDFDWLAILDATVYARGGWPLSN